MQPYPGVLGWLISACCSILDWPGDRGCCLTRERSLVRTQPRPLSEAPHMRSFLVIAATGFPLNSGCGPAVVSILVSNARSGLRSSGSSGKRMSCQMSAGRPAGAALPGRRDSTSDGYRCGRAGPSPSAGRARGQGQAGEGPAQRVRCHLVRPGGDPRSSPRDSCRRRCATGGHSRVRGHGSGGLAVLPMVGFDAPVAGRGITRTSVPGIAVTSPSPRPGRPPARRPSIAAAACRPPLPSTFGRSRRRLSSAARIRAASKRSAPFGPSPTRIAPSSAVLAHPTPRRRPACGRRSACRAVGMGRCRSNAHG